MLCLGLGIEYCDKKTMKIIYESELVLVIISCNIVCQTFRTYHLICSQLWQLKDVCVHWQRLFYLIGDDIRFLWTCLQICIGHSLMPIILKPFCSSAWHFRILCGTWMINMTQVGVNSQPGSRLLIMIVSLWVWCSKISHCTGFLTAQTVPVIFTWFLQEPWVIIIRAFVV